MPRSKALLAMTFLISIFGGGIARGAEIEKLLMPGPVSAAHAEIEGKCESCHDRSQRSRQTELCASCHKPVATDIRERTGHHGHLPAAQSGECQACHTEHRGRNANIARIDPAHFDHSQTDFRLTGAHATLECGNCHQPKSPFRNTASTCAGCHAEDDVHKGSLGKECGSCHATTAWPQIRFDHGKTRFPLQARHESVPCAACHFGERYKQTPTQCAACHTPDDVHRGSRGTQCSNCHTPAGWAEAKFDHAKETGFALLGRHSRATCTDCHRTGKLDDKPPTTCVGCHRSDDRHSGRFGPQCGDCHSNEVWRVAAFDHLSRSKFALEGEHSRIDCHACHTGRLKEQKLETECGACHRAADVHGGSLGAACANCHTTVSWKTDLSFDHDLTTFPLVGLHVIVTCAQCHKSRDFRDSQSTCHGCHAKNDVHKGSLGVECADCHSPNGWKQWTFDHAVRTRFALTGAHKPLQCAACHVKPATEVKLGSDCASCHLSDDIHSGRFGRQCQRCHTTSAFTGARPN
jgi:hypothetical protein